MNGRIRRQEEDRYADRRTTQPGSAPGSIFDKNEAFTATGILTPEIVTALVGLSLLSLLPVAYKKIKARHA